MRFLILVAIAAGYVLQGAPSVTLAPQISEARGLADWDLDGSGTWNVRGQVLALEKAGVPGGKIRRPAALAILKSEPLTDLTLRVELRSTAPVDLAVRDVQLIVGYQSPSQFYYVHISAKTDPVHNGIFLVNNADRRRIDEPTSKAWLTDQAWHRVRLERDTATGRIAVFFDDHDTPVLTATDKTLTWGRVGVGSFDETGEFRNIEVTGRGK
ncbi:MAG: hypothetical protein ACRD15_14435 [Vicinamibacterales bacterium]